MYSSFTTVAKTVEELKRRRGEKKASRCRSARRRKCTDYWLTTRCGYSPGTQPLRPPLRTPLDATPPRSERGEGATPETACMQNAQRAETREHAPNSMHPRAGNGFFRRRNPERGILSSRRFNVESRQSIARIDPPILSSFRKIKEISRGNFFFQGYGETPSSPRFHPRASPCSPRSRETAGAWSRGFCDKGLLSRDREQLGSRFRA